MRHKIHIALSAALLLLAAAALPARAVDAPYERDLLRLAELMGSLHYLRNLCGEEGYTWRNQMQALLDAEQPDETRRARLIAHFNQGYRSFGSTYTGCTPSAVEAIERFTSEGETLSKNIVSRYGS